MKLSKLFKSHSEREVKRVIPIVDKIESLEPEYQELTDEQLRGKTDDLKNAFLKVRHLMIFYRRHMRRSVRLQEEFLI